MKRKSLFSIMMGVIMLLLTVSPVKADGIIIPEPPPFPVPEIMAQLVIRYHHVEVKIEDQLATVHVDQVFYNPNNWDVEGTYVFPLPVDAVVSDFILWMDGEPVKGEVLDAEEARQVYEDIVLELRDPALLEYIGRNAVQASIYPIPSGGERRIELEYTQMLTVDNGLVRFVYPLNTEKFSALPIESVAVIVEVSARQPVRAVYSPTHPVSVSRESDKYIIAGYEASNITPDTDFALYYSLGETEAFHLFSYRDSGDTIDSDGTFLLLLAPEPGYTGRVVKKDMILVLDRSGSMEGDKFSQARSALSYILKHLNTGDRFHLISFSSGIEIYANELRPESEATEALVWVDQLSAVGSTDINRALLEAAMVADRERPTYLIFLTDGLPTEGVTDSQQIIDNFAREAHSNIRLFTFGVGYDVDTFLLDSLSQEHHGMSTYVKPGEALDEILSAFYARISTPVMTNLKLDFGNLAVYDLYPNPLPDLFKGTQVIVVGRYRYGGAADVTVSGEVNGMPKEFHYPEQDFTTDSRGTSDASAGIPRLWATRKIGYLLNRIRLEGPDPETIDQIVKISIRYGIVTPYTSYLVTDPMPLGAANQERLSHDEFEAMEAMPSPAVSGEAAVEKAVEQGALSRAEVAPPVPETTDRKVRTLGAQTFVFCDGVWMDTTYDPDSMEPMQVAFLSPDYFALAQSRSDVAAALALGEKVIIVVGDKAYEVVAEGTDTPPLLLPTVSESDTNDTQVNNLSTQVDAPVLNQETSKPSSHHLDNPQEDSIMPVLPCLGFGGLLSLTFLLLLRLTN